MCQNRYCTIETHFLFHPKKTKALHSPELFSEIIKKNEFSLNDAFDDVEAEVPGKNVE